MTYGRPPSETPLKPAVFHILLALSNGQLHGLGIADAVEEETEGDMRLAAGTLYRSLKEMAEAGMVEQVDSADPRRTSYRLTDSGQQVLRQEAQRLARLVELARGRDILPSRP